jgi:hypothetical protein
MAPMLSSHAISESTAMWSVSEDGVVRNRSRNIERACMPNERTCLHTHTRGRAFMLQLDVRVRRAYGAPVALEAPIGPQGHWCLGPLGLGPWAPGPCGSSFTSFFRRAGSRIRSRYPKLTWVADPIVRHLRWVYH